MKPYIYKAYAPFYFFKNVVYKLYINIKNFSHKNYSAPKVTQKLHEIGEKVSEKTIGNYMKELGIKAQY